MPEPLWLHTCRNGETFLIDGPECLVCDEPGDFDDWRLTGAELDARYRYVFGLEPAGPHRALADLVFADLRHTCWYCGGRSVITGLDGGWCMCTWCEGTGGVWVVPWEDVEVLRRIVVAHYPSADAGASPVRFALEENEFWE